MAVMSEVGSWSCDWKFSKAPGVICKFCGVSLSRKSTAPDRVRQLRTIQCPSHNRCEKLLHTKVQNNSVSIDHQYIMLKPSYHPLFEEDAIPKHLKSFSQILVVGTSFNGEFYKIETLALLIRLQMDHT
jgi:hypothetical protein